MSNLHRTQIYVDSEQMQMLRIVARKKKLSISELIRTAIQNLLETRVKGLNWDKDPLNKAIGKIRLADNDTSLNHDHYLYGTKKGR